MSQEPDDIKRWTARRKAVAVMDIIKGKTSAAELARIKRIHKQEPACGRARHL